MAQGFSRHYEYDASEFVIVNYNDIIPENHPARFIKKFIAGVDVRKFEQHYKIGEGRKGRAPFDVRLMLGVILYALYSRIYSAHKIETACEMYADFWFFTHKQRISHDKISAFISKHKNEIKILFAETIRLANKNDMLDFKHIFVDGFPIKANASRRKYSSANQLIKRSETIQKYLGELLGKMKGEGKTYKSEEIKRAEKQLEKIEALQEELNERVRHRSQKDSPSEIEKRKEKIKINETDPDAELTNMKNGSYGSGYTKVVALDGKSDIIVASDVDGHCDESHKLMPVMRGANESVQGNGEYTGAVADSAYNTKGNCVQFEAHNYELISPTREYEQQKRNKELDSKHFVYDEYNNCVHCPEGKTLRYRERHFDKQEGTLIHYYFDKKQCASCPRLAECTKSKKGYRKVKIDVRKAAQDRALKRYLETDAQELYKKRMHVGEVFQGDLKRNGGFHHFLRRGRPKVRIDSIFQDIIWNLRRIFNEKGAAAVMA